jgi:endogenous inhibitor of DNA gyrase (YacG/DUF329 family)
MANDPAKPDAAKPDATRPARPCPICGKPQAAATRPFCSDRCRDVDLNRWLSGSYAIPARDGEEDPE